MDTNKLAVNAIKIVNSLVNFITLVIILLLLVFAAYALWDSRQLHQRASSTNYEIFKPTVENSGKSFAELQAINPEVIAWLTVYDTNIDYPVTQGKDNVKYVTTNSEGLYSLSGAIFLDYRNSKHFTDFNSILYGHHMARQTMFGEIADFADKDIFEARKYGNLYVDDTDYGIEFFAFVHTDAYDTSILSPNVTENKQAYLDNLLAIATHKRDINITEDDRIVLLTTCSASSTNGRDILIGRITDETFEDVRPEVSRTPVISLIGGVASSYLVQWLLLAALLLLTGLCVYIFIRRRKRDKQKN
jgi:sortase B